MLIYNHKYELVGIDSEDLHMLGFASLKEMLSECHDIADFFVKKPGYIHNFKNFKWIDFILHAESNLPKAIVQTSQRGFACDIVISPFFLAQTPDEKAYAITLAHIKPISGYDASDFVQEAPAHMEAKPAPAAAAVVTPQPPVLSPAEPAPSQPTFKSAPKAPQPEPEPFDLPASDDAAFDPYDHEEDLLPAFSKPLDIEEDLFLSPEATPAAPAKEESGFPPEATPETPPEKAPKEETPMLGDYITPQEKDYIDNLTVSKDYVYDPQVAADELGLPVDLIEEFIGDFIQQSYDFRDELFEMAAKSDFDNVKILSHKLKGVAANLRIENAFEVLSVINSSGDQAEIQANLKHFYHIIARLEGKDAAPSPDTLATAPIPAEDDIAADIFEEAAPAPTPPSDTGEDDLYAFDIITDKPEASPSPDASRADEEADDLYDFDAAFSPSAEKRPDTADSETLQPEEHEDDLYAFDLPDTPEPELPPMPDLDDDFDDDLVPTSMEPEVVDKAVSESSADEEPQTVLHYDTAKVAEELGLSFEIVHELQNDFVADAILAKNTLEDAVAASKSAVWQESASRLKGITDNLRMSEISQVLHTLSHTDDAAEADKAVHMLYSYVDQL